MTHLEIIGQLKLSIEGFSSKQYESPLKVLNNKTVGQHFRHIIEFYQCLLQAKETQLVNYEKRERNAEIESNRNYALQVVEIISPQISEIDGSVPVTVEFHHGDELCLVASSFGRELLYLSEHSIHHFAQIKIAAMTHFPEIEQDDSFGVAPSTVRYESKNSSCVCSLSCPQGMEILFLQTTATKTQNGQGLSNRAVIHRVGSLWYTRSIP